MSATGKDSISLDDSVAKELSQFMNFFPRVNAVALQPADECSPMRLAAVAAIRRRLPAQRGIDHEAILLRPFEIEQFFHQ